MPACFEAERSLFMTSQWLHAYIQINEICLHQTNNKVLKAEVNLTEYVWGNLNMDCNVQLILKRKTLGAESISVKIFILIQPSQQAFRLLFFLYLIVRLNLAIEL